MAVALRKGPVVDIAEIDSKRTDLREVTWNRQIFPHLSREKKRKNPKPKSRKTRWSNSLVIIGGMSVKTTTRNQIASDWEPSYRQTVNGGESWEMMEPPRPRPDMFCGNGHWQQSLERIAFIGQKENFERAKPRIFIPTAGPILQKSHHSKWHMPANAHCSATSNSQDTNPQNCPWAD